MRKLLFLLFIQVFYLFGLEIQDNTIVSINNNFTTQEKEYISSHTISLGMIEDYYPFSFKEDDKITGFSYDFIQLVIKKSGLNIDITMDNWSNTLLKFRNKQIDLIDVISYNEERAQYTNFSESYFEIPNVIFARNGEFNGYTGFESLKGKKVGITKDIYYYDTIKSLGLFELVEFKESKEKMKALAYGHLDAIFNNLISGQKYIKRGAYSNIKVLEELDSDIIKKEDLRIGIQKENKILFSILNKSMIAVTRDEKEKLYNKWFSAKTQLDDEKKTVVLTYKEKEYLKKKQKINMCIDPDWMPFEKLENGKHIGLASDYIKIVQKHIKIPIELIVTENWTESLNKAKNRECDILSMASLVKYRQEFMNFTSPYLDIPMLITTKIDEPFIDNITQILDKKIGVVKSYSIGTHLKDQYPNINLVEVDSINDGLRQVESGKIFAFVDNLATINYEIQKRFIETIKVSGRLNIRNQYRMATRNDEPILHNIFEKIILDIDVETKDDMFRKWINPIQKETIIDYTMIWYIVIIVSGLLSLFVYRQYSLKKSNNILQKAVEDKTHDLQKLNENLELKIKQEVQINLQIQEKLFKSEKLAAMGEMIGNISHQWRQPLSVISTASTGIIMQKEYGLLDETKLIDTCNIINDNAQYLSKTIDDFRNFIRGNRIKLMFKLEDTINSFSHLMESSIKKYNINIILNLDKDIMIDGYENELTQCLINIFNNAKDALIEKKVEDKLIFINTSIEDNEVIIQIKDNANGIEDALLKKIFEPYFTTKHQKQGTGLGLHMTYTLISEGMNGTIEAKNISFKYNNKNYTGAEFIIKLPRS